MRIVGGRFRGRPLVGPHSRAIRPTSDRLRETLFNVLTHAYVDPISGARVIDLFAGTGALGLEALSRGADFALFVDKEGEARALLRENVERLGLGGQTRIFRRDAAALGDAPPGPGFNLAFLDPPYGVGLAESALASLQRGGWLADGALCIVEEEASVALTPPQGFALLERRQQGETQLVFLRCAVDTSKRDSAPAQMP